jgi:hypothetical protein
MFNLILKDILIQKRNFLLGVVYILAHDIVFSTGWKYLCLQ